jgi:glycosyltransferase involved in cell wall biosynthesis
VKVAYYSPLPPERTGISEYSALLLPALGRRVEIEVARRGHDPRADIAVYHIGNNPAAHDWIVDALRRRPGVVVLHDFVLHHLVAGMTLARGDQAGYLRAMQHEHGLPGWLLALGLLEGTVPMIWEQRPEDFPLAGEVLSLADALVVHSGYVERLAREAGYEGRLWRIPMAAWPLPEGPAERPAGGPVFASFGHHNASKRVPQLVEAFRLARERLPEARLLLVGSLGERYALPQLPEGAEHVDYVDEDRLWALMRGADVHVSLRFPTMGETSGSVVRSLSLAKPLVVSDVGWFAELPDSAALKVAPGPDEVEALAAALVRAVEEAPALGAASLAYARTELDLQRVAGLHAAALVEAAGGERVTDAVLGELAGAAAFVGIGADDPLAGELAARAAEAGIAA